MQKVCSQNNTFFDRIWMKKSFKFPAKKHDIARVN